MLKKNKKSLNLKRKSATVLVKIMPGVGKIIINGKSMEEYMQNNPR
jgi:ribosomal protein S9